MRATLAKSPAQVAAMFDAVAARYDLTNDVLSLGLDRGWRRAVLRLLDLRAGERVLDLAAGTGTSAAAVGGRGAWAVGVDLSRGMLAVGRGRHPRLPLAAADGLRLPFRDRAFDAVTASFGLRNVVDPDAALRELLRVTRPGGRLVLCEFSLPALAPLRRLYTGYLLRALPALARRVSSDPEAYEYLSESILAWPDQPALARRVAAAGWTAVGWRNLTGGVVAVHLARRPPGALPEPD